MISFQSGVIEKEEKTLISLGSAYENLVQHPEKSPDAWSEPSTHSECTLHQLSPYIGKLKSSIAKDLIKRFSKPGDVVADVFSGSGTIPLESILLGRKTIALDASKYAMTLTKGKLFAPGTLAKALTDVDELLEQAAALNAPDLDTVPEWVQSFFHPETLKQAINFSTIAMNEKHYFLMGCLLGILHHQRPGFLSYPSSHLVPYLRDKKYPRDQFPDMYEFRELRSRLIAKVRRAYKREGSRVEENIVFCEQENVREPEFKS